VEVKMPKAQTKESSSPAKEKKDTSKKLTKEEFFEHLDNLTVLELADYIKEFEERYGISAAAAAVPMAVPGGAAPAEAPQEEEKTEFTVILKEVGDRRSTSSRPFEKLPAWVLKKPKTWLITLLNPLKKVFPRKKLKRLRRNSKKLEPRLSCSKAA